MKKTIVFLVMTLVFNQFLYSQSPINYKASTIVYTCKGGVIQASLASRELNARELDDLDYELFNPLGKYYYVGLTRLDIVTQASATYNCHAYAWHLTEGNTNRVWIDAGINTSNLSTYWSSNYGCFASSNASDATKIHYYSGDHSAVKSSVTGKYESKFGQWYLFRHDPEQVPYVYDGSKRNYYIGKPIGPTLLCLGGSPQNFSVNYWQSGFTWDKSSNLNLSNSGSSVSVSANGLGLGWVSFKKSNGVELARTEVWVGPPLVNNVTGPHTVQKDLSYMFSASVLQSALAAPSYFNWTVIGGSYSMSFQGSSQVYITFHEATDYVIGVSAQNACGASTAYYVQVYAGRSTPTGIAYPNPVDNILFVDLDAFAAANPALSSSSARIAYDIRLYDGRGSLVRQQKAGGGMVEFDVSNLPNGTYYLHVYDGVSSTPEMYQIIVQH